MARRKKSNTSTRDALLAEHIMKLHTLAGLNSISDDVLVRHVDNATPDEEGLSLYERIQQHGLVMWDNETVIKVDATRTAIIKGTPLWKKNLLTEYERDTKGTGIVSSWCKFIYPDVAEVTNSEDYDLDNADDPDYGIPSES